MGGNVFTLKRTAHREAGHAVAAWSNGLKFKHVTVAPNVDSFGHMLDVRPKWFDPESARSGRVRCFVERSIIVRIAGQLAEARFIGKRTRYGMRSDNKRTLGLAFYMGGSGKTTNAYLRYCWSASEDLVTMRWSEIKLVAAALLEKQTLRYLDVIETIMPGSAALRASPAALARKAASARWKDKKPKGSK
jgi:hypothetical protein